MKLLGTIVQWIPNAKNGAYGIVQIKNDTGRIENYFLPQTRLIFLAADQVRVGMAVLFDAEQPTINRPNAYPIAVRAEVYDSIALAKLMNRKEQTPNPAGLGTLSGVSDEQSR